MLHIVFIIPIVWWCFAPGSKKPIMRYILVARNFWYFYYIRWMIKLMQHSIIKDPFLFHTMLRIHSFITAYFWKREVGSSHLHAPFGTFCVQIGQIFEAQWGIKMFENGQKVVFEGKCHQIRILQKVLSLTVPGIMDQFGSKKCQK